MSLIQTAVVQTNAAKPGSPGQTTMQTVEAGWVALPCQVSQPHIFTYYTINDYATQGDNAGGWNRDYKGWGEFRLRYAVTMLRWLNGFYSATQSDILPWHCPDTHQCHRRQPSGDATHVPTLQRQLVLDHLGP